MERTLRVPHEVAARIRSLHPDLKSKVRSGLDAILREPHVGKPLKDDLAGMCSLRVGRLRIIYRLHGKSVEIVAIGPRRTIYEETWRRVRRR